MKKIKSIEISGSAFYHDLKLDFSDKLNCLMGGRGTGKTTLLYFLKSTMNANPQDSESSILKSNLGNGTIVVEIEGEDALIYKITKTLYEEPQPYLIPGQEYVSINKIFAEIECDFYEAGRIEEIGRNSKDRLELIDKKIKNEIKDSQTDIRKLQIDLDANAQDIKTYNKRLQQMDDVMIQYQNVQEEFDAHKAQQPVGMVEEEKNAFEQADVSEKTRNREKRLFNKTIDTVKGFQYRLADIEQELKDYLQSDILIDQAFDNKELMAKATNLISETINQARAGISKVSTDMGANQDKLNDLFNSVLGQHELQQAEFVQLKQKFEINKEYINKYNVLSKKVNEKAIIIQDREELFKKRQKLKEQRLTAITNLNNLKQDIFSKRLDAVKSLNASFNEDVVITLDFGGIKDEYQEKLRNALKGSGLRYNELVTKIASSFTPDTFADLIHKKDLETLKNIMGIDDIRANAIISALSESEEIYDLECLYCHDLPEFKLKIASDSPNKEDNYRKTDELSMGQRCTTVLPIIFAVSNNPLIIDQPEDNLDNKYITQRIHEIIRQQKEKRQLIFITHNPNIPVLSDADLNIFLVYNERRSQIEKTGNVTEVKDEIVSLLEGGEDAFKKRMEIYGFEK